MYLTRAQADALEDAAWRHTDDAREILYEEHLYGPLPGHDAAHNAHVAAANHLWWLAHTLGDTAQPSANLPF